MHAAAVTAALKNESAKLGFALAGVCPAVAPTGLTRFHQWLDAGYAGEMRYLPDRADAYEHPRHVLDGAKSVVMLAMNYRTDAPRPPAPGQGRVSRYAWGEADYHDVIHDRLKRLKKSLIDLAPDARARGVVDTAPLLERDFAQLAGLGWIGKNTLLLNKQLGSWFFLAALLTDVELEYDEPHQSDHCGTCRACLDACPTDAFVAPYVLDATRCISYLTIELRDAAPMGLREGIGDWVFGCDVCQEVCPWNGKAPLADEPAFSPNQGHNPMELIELFDLDDEEFRRRYRRTPFWRSRRAGLLRNAAIVLGNQRGREGLGALLKGLSDAESQVRAACAWALGKKQGRPAAHGLAARLKIESDPDVRAEIEAALVDVE